jgi:hypothetical protein
MSKAVRVINTIGAAMEGDAGDKVREIRVFAEGGSVQLWVELSSGEEVMQYLDPGSAMAFANAFDRCAMAALRESTKLV